MKLFNEQKLIPNKMNFRTICMSKIILSILFLLVIQSINAQQGEEVLIFQVDGNNYVKKNYNKIGELLDYQIIKIGKVRKNDEQNTMSIRLYNYDKSGNLLDSSRTKYICNPKDSQLQMNIFSFAFLSANKTLMLKAKDNSNLYPIKWEVGKKMPDVLFTAEIDGGAISAFGGGGEVKIYDRSVTSYDNSNDWYQISSKLRINVYAYGVRLKTIDYFFKETVSPQKGIIAQYFKESTGEYFTIKLKQ